jgi:hypothetical protein
MAERRGAHLGPCWSWVSADASHGGAHRPITPRLTAPTRDQRGLKRHGVGEGEGEHELGADFSSFVLPRQVKSAPGSGLRSDGKNLVEPLITGRRTFNSGSWTCSSNPCSSLDPESCPFSPSSKSPLTSSLSCSHSGCQSGGNSPTKSIINQGVDSKPVERQCSKHEMVDLLQPVSKHLSKCRRRKSHYQTCTP